MKARIEDGQVKIYGELPSKFLGVTGNYAGGFHLVDVDTQQQEGFFDIEEPTYNKILEVLSPIYFDEEKKVFTYKVEPKPGLPTLEQAKKNKIQELKMKARDKFSETDWYYTRSLRMKELGLEKEIPLEIIEQSERIYALLDKKEAEINNISTGDDLADLEAVLTYDTSVNDPKVISPEELLEKDPEAKAETPAEPEAGVDGEADANPDTLAGTDGEAEAEGEANDTPAEPEAEAEVPAEPETPAGDSPSAEGKLPAGDTPDSLSKPAEDTVPQQPVVEPTPPTPPSTLEPIATPTS